MRFIRTVDGMEPTDGAIIPHLLGEAGDSAKQAISDTITYYVHLTLDWLATDGITLLSELTLLWGMACFLVAITGTHGWMARGAKAVTVSVMLGVVRYAI
jgi:hypothetical protein